MFDLLNWRWDYEPIDLEGYIPDFILGFGEPLLVEVKPVPRQAFREHINKIALSGWIGYGAIVGNPYEYYYSEPRLGAYVQVLNFVFGNQSHTRVQRSHAEPGAAEWSLPLTARSQKSTWLAGCGSSDADSNALRMLWREAGNRVQWKAPCIPAPDQGKR